MKRRSKILLVIGMVSAVLVAGLVVGYVIISMDEDPTDDSDLRPARLDIPDEQNGYTYFAQASRIWVWPGIEKKEDGSRADVPGCRNRKGSTIDEERRELLSSVLLGDKRDHALAAELLKSNEAALALCDKGLACPFFQLQEVLNYKDSLADWCELLHLGNLMRLCSQAHLRAGKSDDAWQEAIKVVRFGHTVENGRGILIGWLIGRTVKGLGLETLRQTLRDSSAPPDRLKQYAADLMAFSDDGAGLAQTMCAEYQWHVNILEDFRSGDYALDRIKGLTPEAKRAAWQRYLNRGVLLRYNETKRLLAEPTRVIIENASKPYSERKPYVRTWRTANERGVLGHLLDGNLVGRMLLTLLSPSVEGAVGLKYRGQIDTAATRALIALKAFKTETGRLPETLAELVPEFLDAVPLDDFDGKPLRYSREKKCVYSVGADLVDSGGHSKEGARQWWTEHKPDEPLEEGADPDTWSLPDPSFFIEF